MKHDVKSPSARKTSPPVCRSARRTESGSAESSRSCLCEPFDCAQALPAAADPKTNSVDSSKDRKNRFMASDGIRSSGDGTIGLRQSLAARR